MTTIYRYQPVIIPGPAGTDYRPRADLPDETTGAALAELATLDGWRYVAVADGATLTVPDELETWEAVTLTDESRDAIKAASPHAKLALAQFAADLRARYTLDDELYFARIATGALMGTYQLQPGEAEQLAAYQQHVEACRLALKARYGALGL